MAWSRLGVSSPFDVERRLVTSPFFFAHTLALLRIILALYCTGALVFSLAYESIELKTGSLFFSFFTNLSFVGLCAYFWAAGVQTILYARWGEVKYPLQKWPKFLQFLHLLLQSTVITFPIVVTSVFWMLLASSKTFADLYASWANITFHALNSGFALFEILLTHAPPAPWLLLPFSVLFLSGYLGIAYITFATQGVYTYPFLDPQTSGPLVLVAYIAAIAASDALVFALVRGLVALRVRVVPSQRSYAALSGDGEEEKPPMLGRAEKGMVHGGTLPK